MNHLSAEPLIRDEETAHMTRTSRMLLILTAWLGTLLLSRLPQIIFSELGLITPADWSLWWWIIIGAALFTLTYVWPAVKSLRGYFVVLTMIYVVTILWLFLEQTSCWVSRFGPQKPWLVDFSARD